MKVAFAVLADAVSVDADGKITLVGIGVDAVVTAAVPATHPRLVVALKVWVTEEEARERHRVDVRVNSPDGAQVGATHSLLEPVPESHIEFVRSLSLPGIGMGAVLDTRGLPMPSYGVYEVTVRWDDQPLETLRLAVIEPPASAPS